MTRLTTQIFCVAGLFAFIGLKWLAVALPHGKPAPRGKRIPKTHSLEERIMSAVWIILLFILGLLLTIKGGDLFVDAASWIAEVSGIPKFIVGATIVSLATTLPELLVSMMAASRGSIGISVGNAVGSVTANIGLIMALSLIFMPAVIRRREYAFKFAMLAAGILLLYLFSISGELKLGGAVLLLILFVVFMAENVLSARRQIGMKATSERPARDRKSTTQNVVKFILGAAGIVAGAQLMVNNGTELARLLGIPEAIIGATLVAIGTSLPELVTTLTAIAKKQSSLSIGNIVGANIIDLTLILPLCAVVSGKNLPMLAQNIQLDMPFCLGLVLLSTVPTFISGKLRRAQGVLLLAVYAIYVVLLVISV